MNETQEGRRERRGKNKALFRDNKNKIQNSVIGRISWNLNTGHELGFIR